MVMLDGAEARFGGPFADQGEFPSIRLPHFIAMN